MLGVKQIAAALMAVVVLALIGVAVLLSFLPENSEQRSPLHDAAVYENCDLAMVRMLVEDDGLVPTAPASPASGAHAAVEGAFQQGTCVAILDYDASLGVDFSDPDEAYLESAARQRSPLGINWLVDHGADICAPPLPTSYNRDFNSIADLAAARGSIAVLTAIQAHVVEQC